MNKVHIILLSTLQLFAISIFAQQTYQPTGESIDSRPVPEWFEDAKFGIFIHWGLYSVPAFSPTKRDKVGVYDQYAEWYWNRLVNPSKTQQFFIDFYNRVYGKDFNYQDFTNLFKAEMFNPDEWAVRFKEAGAKYIVLTSKHQDGFTLWPSQQSWNWKSVDVGPHRDLCGDLTNSIKTAGLRMGFYYALYEWFNPLYKADLNKYVDEHMIPQMKDLVTRYQPDILWTDGELDHPSEAWKNTQFLA
jgi:alpha-L-fucosidase